MRIISGIAKGRKLLSPEDYATRPTLDRVKEAMFNIIAGYVPGAITLDMFAGTGSLGLEAISRGAKYCYLFEKDSKSYSILKENIKVLDFSDSATAFNYSCYDGIKVLSDKNIKFDLIFIDPPYMKSMIPTALELIDKYKLLNEDSIIVTKIDSKEKVYEGINNINLIDKRKYGKTIVCFYKIKEGE
ncbi:MAG TPA: 16S rRNA (guanine(966)-N(2))-methyltransferase RsmD [Clostridiaceae bacterium]